MYCKVNLNSVNSASDVFSPPANHRQQPFRPSETPRRRVGAEECTLAPAQWKPFVEDEKNTSHY